MTITERAQRNHDALFPGHKSILKGTDPELIELFDNRAFDELLDDQTLNRCRSYRGCWASGAVLYGHVDRLAVPSPRRRATP